MKQMIFTCETVTPLVINGPYGNVPELRPPGIKATLRFWWRALHGHLSLDDLRVAESRIFGNTEGRSKVLIRVVEMNQKNVDKNTYLLPHKGKNWEKSPMPAFVKNLTFKIRMDYDGTIISKDIIKNLFIVACTLGGWGKRSRRGFGSIAINEIDGIKFASPITIPDIFKSIDEIVKGKYKLSDSIIARATTSPIPERYPKLLKIEIGKNPKSLRDISQATHDIKKSNWNEYSNSVGSGKPRYASPVYISFLSNGLPIISTLSSHRKVDVALQNKLKLEIL